MFDLFLRILPILGLFAAGVALRRLGLLTTRHSDGLLRLVVYAALPALILGSITSIALQANLVLLPVSAALTILATWPAALVAGKVLRLERATLGAFVTGAMIMNMAFEYPFVLLAWGHEGFAHFALFDFGNGLLVLTVVYAQASWFGGSRQPGRIAGALVRFPPFWALAVALVMNAFGVQVPGELLNGLKWVGSVLVLLVPLALGIYFEPGLIGSAPLLTGIVLRVGLGLLLGLSWVSLFDLEGLMRAVVVVGAAAPVGFNTLVFASLQNLDRRFAASLASVSMLLALAYLPVIIYMLS